jgi:hypothetical protein
MPPTEDRPTVDDCVRQMREDVAAQPILAGVLRRHSVERGFAEFCRDFSRHFGPVSVLTVSSEAGTLGRHIGPGVPFSDPPPLALKRGKR